MCKRICKTRKTASRKYYKTKNRICKKNQNLKKAGELNKSLNKVIAIAENYPELKSKRTIYKFTK